jgi:hypothetical protein
MNGFEDGSMNCFKDGIMNGFKDGIMNGFKDGIMNGLPGFVEPNISCRPPDGMVGPVHRNI